jgi:cytochrome c-type biogenesis protein
MDSFWTFINELMYSDQSWILIIGSLLWGIASVIMSPCHLTGAPLMLGYMMKQEDNKKNNAFLLTTIFAVSVFLSIILIGFITGGLGLILGDLGMFGQIFLILMLLYFGLATLGLVPLFPGLSSKPGKAGYLGMFIAGLAFGIGLGPCTFAFMSPILGIVLSKISEAPLMASSLIISFGVGHSIVLILFGVFFQKLGFLNKGAKFGSLLKSGCGILLIVFAIYKSWEFISLLV